ncbi:SDR family NAD(P)-dependent oxidoreductase [Reyranella sp.]|uniref:SDR family NAD(P)-dependent oxidoreductase n=1 Tax=Reyranella sp. TaxID=1929291 RepID=UPI003D0D9F46
MKIVVIGATSGIAEHCCRQWATEDAADFVLMARNTAKMEKIAADLKVRGARSISFATPEFFDPAAIKAFADATVAAGEVDLVLIAHGWMSSQQSCQEDLAVCRESLEVNAVSPVLFAEAFAAHFARANRGTIAIIGSVAGDRGRKANYTYAASKGLLGRYAEGMQHRFAGSGVKIVLIKPGPTDTPMAAAHKARGRKLAPVAQVARETVNGIRRGRPMVYTPQIWWPIMLIVRHVPRFVFNRLSI